MFLQAVFYYSLMKGQIRKFLSEAGRLMHLLGPFLLSSRYVASSGSTHSLWVAWVTELSVQPHVSHPGKDCRIHPARSQSPGFVGRAPMKGGQPLVRWRSRSPYTCCPQLSTITCPVIAEESEEARNRTADATSASSVKRPRDIFLKRAFSASF
jgi:hypothetical protein